MSFIAKAAFAGVMVALVTIVAKRSPGWGGLLAALPITSILALSLLYVDTGDRAQVAQLSRSIIAFILPSVPLFIVLPILLRTNLNFWVALGAVVLMTLALYAITFWALPKLGVRA